MVAIYILCVIGAASNFWVCSDYIKRTKGRLPLVPFLSALMFAVIAILV